MARSRVLAGLRTAWPLLSVFDALARQMPPDAIVVEETPSSQPELYQRLPITNPAGYYAAANGGLGFGLAGTIGLRMGAPSRPVIGIVGDGSSMYVIQSLWSAAQYHVGALLIVMSNGRYAVMDRLARDAGGEGAWPAFDGVDITGIAERLDAPVVMTANARGLVPPDPPSTLAPNEVELIADFLFAKVIGKGPMDRAKCIEYWGEEAETCKEFPK